MKKRWTKRTAALLLSVVLLFTTAQGALAAWAQEDLDKAANLIVNPGFEDGSKGWRVGDDTKIDANAAHRGKSGLASSYCELSQEIVIPKAGEYEFSMFYKAEETLLAVGFFLNTDQEISYTVIHSATGGWQRMCAAFLFPEELVGSTVQLSVSALNAYGIYIDDVSLTHVEGLPPPLLLDPERNALPNPDFESGLDGWKYSQNSTVYATADARSGKQAMAVLPSKPDGFASVSAQIPQDLEPGEYEISAYVCLPHTAPDTSVSLSVNESSDFSFSPAELFLLPIPQSAGTWLRLSIVCSLYLETFKPPYHLAIEGNAPFYLDDVSLTPTSAALNEGGTNLLQNAGFEAGLPGWASKGGPCAFSTDAQALEGLQSAYFGYFASGPLENYLEQTCPTQGDGAYTLSAFVKPDPSLTGTGGVLVLEARDAGGNVIASATSPAVNNASKGWQKTSVTLNVPKNAATLAVKIGGVYCTGAFYTDLVTLNKVSGTQRPGAVRSQSAGIRRVGGGVVKRAEPG